MRCSALPLATKCRGSYKLTQGYGSAISRVGTAFHEAARAKVLKQQFDATMLQVKYGLTDEEMRSINYGIYNITVVIPDGSMIIADDKKMTGLNGKLTGTPDLGIFSKKILTVIDWKSGWGDVEDPGTNNQLIGYALLTIEELEKAGQELPEKIVLVVVQPRINQVKTAVFTLDMLQALKPVIEAIIDEAEKGVDDYTSGPWCQGCFKSMNCPAFAGQVMTLAKYVQPEVLDPIDVEKALKILLPVAKAVGPMSDKIQELAKAWVKENGPLDLGGGQTFCQVVGTKQEVNAKKAFETLKEYFDEDRIWEVITANMTKISALAVATKRGLSTIVKNRLIEVGALTEETTVKYTIIKGGDKDAKTGTGKETRRIDNAGRDKGQEKRPGQDGVTA